MYIITGAAGFIGSHLVQELNRKGISEIIAVDSLSSGSREKYRNLCDCQLIDYYDREEFRELLIKGSLPRKIRGILHQGACTDTTETDGHHMLENNFTFSKLLLRYALANRIPFVYASSAATYGAGRQFAEQTENERPLNVYGYSKLLFDQYVRYLLPEAESTVIGLRYFNVYGIRELYKGSMASMVCQIYRQIKETGEARLFEGFGGYESGEQKRDFIFVEDVVKINLYFLLGELVKKGIVNCGTGKARSFNELAAAVIGAMGRGGVRYIPVPDAIRLRYQNFTKADLSKLELLGYKQNFTSLEQGVKHCVAAWENQNLQ